jgi:HprK-related kinase A
MQLADFTPQQLERALKREGLSCRIGPFSLQLRNDAPGFASVLALLYARMEVDPLPGRQFEDFTVRLARPRGLRRFYRPQVHFATDSETPFQPFPVDHAFPHFEWGLNWLVATRAHHYLMFHAAILERQGRALMLPAIPGSGKSTLCAALMLRGWRLLSDEFGLYRPENGLLESMPRPIPLKNESIELIRSYDSSAVLGPVYPKTRKGDVAHLKPSDMSMTDKRPVRPAWVVFPQYTEDGCNRLVDYPKGLSFLKLSGNSFNYRLQGLRGFRAVADIVDDCSTHLLEFSRLERAVDALTELTEAVEAPAAIQTA